MDLFMHETRSAFIRLCSKKITSMKNASIRNDYWLDSNIGSGSRTQQLVHTAEPCVVCQVAAPFSMIHSSGKLRQKGKGRLHAFADHSTALHVHRYQADYYDNLKTRCYFPCLFLQMTCVSFVNDKCLLGKLSVLDECCLDVDMNFINTG